MNFYTYRRVKGALILILLGVIFLLQEMNIFRWEHGWPLFLIGLGIILLAERLLPRPPLPPPPAGYYPGQYPPPGYPPPNYSASPYAPPVPPVVVPPEPPSGPVR